MQLTLVILAAGMGSRYGGIKQIEAVGPSGESLIDYSIYNAVKAGYTKIVMVIRKSIEADIKEFFKDKIPKNIPVQWVYQELDLIPKGFKVPEDRKKPWGTGHALLMCKELVKEPLVMINGDDYYAYEALQEVANYLKNTDINAHNYAIVGYELKQTLSPFGSVSRGICTADKNNNLLGLEEHKKIIIDQKTKKIISQFEDPSKNRELTGNEPASMNLFGFTPKFFAQLETGFNDFLKAHINENTQEFYVPAYLGELISKKQASAKILKTKAQWFGITYQEDKPAVKEALKVLVNKKKYPSPLW